MSFDISLFNLIYDTFGKSQSFGWFLPLLSNYLTYILILAFVIFAFFCDKWGNRVYLILLGALSLVISRGIITEIIRFFYEKPRPFIEFSLPVEISKTSSSFPSGHMAFLIPLGIIILYCNKKWGACFLVGVTLVGFARIALGLHWPTDIVAGAVVGAISFYLARKFLPKPSTN